MNKVVADKERCKACGYCIEECPKKAISITTQINKNGYHTIEINESLCIQCGICYLVCPDCVFEVGV